MKKTLIILAALSMPVISRGAPFTADENTLLLSNFEQSTRHADYSLGWNKFAGSGARLTEGYYGKGIDLRGYSYSSEKLGTDDYTAYYTGWGFYPDGNINYRQGTLECWVKLNARGDNFLNAFITRTVKHEKGHYTGTRIGLNTNNLNFLIPFFNGEYREGRINFKQVKGFRKNLSEGWHHFALCWSPGEAAIYLDGRIVAAWDMTGKQGMAIVANPVRYLQMADCVIDDLRISDIVRYPKDFEPNWKDGKRPADAFTGVSDVQRFPQKTEAPFRLNSLPQNAAKPVKFQNIPGEFDQATGRLTDRNGAFGLRLFEGLDRKESAAPVCENFKDDGKQLAFTQNFGTVTAANKLKAKGSDTVEWEITLENRSKREQWLEPILTIPVTFHAKEIFDGTEIRQDLRFQRYRDTYRCTLPLTAASSDKEFISVGLDPSWPYNDLINIWQPGASAAIAQGTRVALSPGEKFTMKFLVSQGGNGKFGALEAVDRYHQLFPEFYRLNPQVTKYSYLPATQYLTSSPYINMQRRGYAGGYWGHGPSHTKGDEYGTEEFWGMTKYQQEKSWNHAARMEKMWGSLQGLRECILYDNKHSFDQGYAVRRFHTNPDQMPEWLVKELWPECKPNDDPLCFGQYYMPISGLLTINEYNTPLGKHINDQMLKYFNHGMKNYSPGWINDMGTSGALFRFNDEIAQKTNGRSFSADLGTFVRSPMGRQQRYQIINDLESNGYKVSIWSDGAWFSYTVQAFSSALAVEGSVFFENLTGNGAALEHSRNMLGEKPITAMSDLNQYGMERLGVPPEVLKDPKAFRDFLRFHFDQLVLYALEQGIQLDPGSYLWGKQKMLELQPLLIDSTVNGRKLISGGVINQPLWLKRGGSGFDTVLMAGNYRNRSENAKMVFYPQYFGGAFIPVNYFGGKCTSEIGTDGVHLAAIVGPRDVAAWKIAAFWDGAGKVKTTSSFEGDGLSMSLELQLENSGPGILRMNPFAPLYEVENLELDGVKVNGSEVKMPAGKHVVKASYRNQVLKFTSGTWNRVELFKGTDTNFKLIASKGHIHKAAIRTWQMGFERGTADFFTDFARQYDWEDGVRGNTRLPEFIDQYDPSYAGWQIALESNSDVNGCFIQPEKRLISIKGRTQGEVRRAAVVLLRLLDRKYPMAGPLIPLEGHGGPFNRGTALPFEKILRGAGNAVLFKNLNDPDFLLKPLLNSEYEPLYSGNDFTGKYSFKVSPFLFEPTYNDNFVYGYSGKGDE